jgi:hypothetical protein
MQSNNKLDELIIAALQADQSNDRVEQEARKERVWESIEFPNRKAKPILFWIIAAAASLSLVVVSSLLLLKVKTQKVEILAMEALIQNSIEVPAKEIEAVQPFEEDLAIERLKAKEKPLAKEQVLSAKPSVVEVGIGRLEDIHADLPEVLIPDLEIPITSTEPLVEISENFVEPLEVEQQVSKKPKLKFRFGNPSASPQNHQALALNIKL